MYELKDGKLLIDGHILEIPNVRFEKEIGKGKNGICFEGHCDFPKRKVVIKIWLSRKDIDVSDEKRFVEEVNKTARINSERVVQIYTAGKGNEVYYAVMEFIEGSTLKDWLLTSPPFEYRRTAMQSLIDGVRLAEKEEVVLGDLHWKNIMILKDNTTKIIDIGTSVYARSTEASHQRSKELLYQTSLHLLCEEKDFIFLDQTNLKKCSINIMLHCLNGLKDIISYINGYDVLEYQLDEVPFQVQNIVTKYPLFDLENLINRFYATEAYKNHTNTLIYIVRNECFKILGMPMSVNFGESITLGYISETIKNYESVKEEFLKSG
ncbi:hypothetical protein BK120_08825 [Paenibacillus sp. FSL A5-0031]|uniref:protein kinase domain-containing protein n=1 Tax=Paenibacillus sp. FSL A5-0031 TaxID=1920420 RepID=UPI00096F3963|nr:protein kinase [Paenibacillus sp. FSL A5-0031]OME86084.1 hypothetical protein BK120_08825 [Paenibacillus sp. FSL A5-0031]